MDITNLKKVVCINLDFHLWSARRKLRLEDLKIVQGEVPPEDLASLGSKKICDPEALSDFENLKKEAERVCAKVGVKFLGGFAVPEDKAKDVATKLDEIVGKFFAKKAVFLRDYDDTLKTWVDSHPGWEQIIRDAALDRDEVSSRLSAGWQAYKIVEADDAANGVSSLTAGLTTAAKGLAGQLYAEIAKAAADVMEKSLVTRDKVTQKILSPIRTIREKLDGLAFIDQRVKPLVETIDFVLEQLPASGHIDGMALTALHGLVFILSDQERMQKHGELVLGGKPLEASFRVSAPVAKPQEPTALVQQNQSSVSAAPIIPGVAVPSNGSVRAPQGMPTINVPVAPVLKPGAMPSLFNF